MPDTDFMYHKSEPEIKPGRSCAVNAPIENSRRAVYAISVAGELTGVDPQMLRVYESRGLLKPARTDGGTRRYSGHDITRIERITMYLEAGLNLAGIERVFVLEAETEGLRDQVRSLGGTPRTTD